MSYTVRLIAIRLVYNMSNRLPIVTLNLISIMRFILAKRLSGYVSKSRGCVLISWGGVPLIHFADRQDYSPGNALLNLHIYARPCIAPAVNYFSLAILL